MSEIEVRLLYPNLGKDRGETVLLDAEEALAWCQRGLAEAVDPKDLQKALRLRNKVRAERAAEVAKAAPPVPPPGQRIPTLRPINPDA